MSLSESTRVQAREIISRYPQARSALLPMLHLVQAEEGYVSADGIALCADELSLTTAEVADTVKLVSIAALDSRLANADSVVMLFYKDPHGTDSLRYTRYYTQYNSNDTALLGDLKLGRGHRRVVARHIGL
jgi:hypothetical protein